MKQESQQARTWLSGNREKVENPFFVLLQYLVELDEQLREMPAITCDEYERYFQKRFFTSDFPFTIDLQPVDAQDDIISFMNAFDHAYLGKMVLSVFVGLIGFLTCQRKRINLLDFGSGPTCGMYGENGRFLFTGKNVDIDAVSFRGIDDMHEPAGSIFKRSEYLRCNILSFDPGEQFDLITGHHVMEHCHDWRSVIAHVSRLLKREGYLYLSFPRFGGFYDTVYRIMSPHDHRSDFDLGTLKSACRDAGLQMCLSDIYVDPNGKFDWICNIYPDLVNQEISDCFYNLCIAIDAKLLLGYHHYGYYVVFRKMH